MQGSADRSENGVVPGVLVVRVEASLVYFNVDHVIDEMMRLIDAAEPDLKLLVWDLSSSPYVNIAGVRMLRDVQQALAGRGAALRLVEARAAVRDLLRAEVGNAVGEVAGGCRSTMRSRRSKSNCAGRVVAIVTSGRPTSTQREP